MALEMRVSIDAADVEWHHLRWKEGLLDKSLRAVELARRLDDSYAQAWPHFLAGFALTILGRGREAQHHPTSVMALAEKLRDRDLLVWASHVANIIYHTLGDWQAAWESTEKCMAMAPRTTQTGILQIKPISLNMGLSEINRTIKWYPERVTAL